MATEWNGEGIPPVGTECEVRWGLITGWIRCVVLSDKHVACHDYVGWCVNTHTCAEFRPLQSEEQKQVAEIYAIITSHDNTASPVIAQEIYNAGFRRVVE